MGIVASGAFTSLEPGVHKSFVHPYFIFFMAFIAGLIALSFQKQLGDYTVSEVAILAFLFLDNNMHVFHFEVFIRKLGVTLQAILAHEPSRFAGRGRDTGN
jgi:hypothetical protein